MKHNKLYFVNAVRTYDCYLIGVTTRYNRAKKILRKYCKKYNIKLFRVNRCEFEGSNMLENYIIYKCSI